MRRSSAPVWNELVRRASAGDGAPAAEVARAARSRTASPFKRDIASPRQCRQRGENGDSTAGAGSTELAWMHVSAGGGTELRAGVAGAESRRASRSSARTPPERYAHRLARVASACLSRSGANENFVCVRQCVTNRRGLSLPSGRMQATLNSRTTYSSMSSPTAWQRDRRLAPRWRLGPMLWRRARARARRTGARILG